ncbi:hypothetical protein B0H17DRAFT_1206669 [Mycena rosella]|uniref:Uncharacterized protein n=1 Tax=Mycena rosella TaxID=1033263 RepID=A0AAD7D4F4_MYCRO|nr:hypothetical protein B0H17DRAFT_1206669 [Mycena rosella]
MSTDAAQLVDKILFSRTPRIYNLRALLLLTAALIPAVVESLPQANTSDYAALYDRYAEAIGIASSGLIVVHHILRLFTSKFYATLDWLLTAFEICILIERSQHDINRSRRTAINACRVGAVGYGHDDEIIPTYISSTFCIFGRLRSKVNYYSGWRILINRSVDRPLVRGEWRSIGIMRGITLSVLCVFLPILGLYTTILSPINAQVFMRQIQPQGTRSVSIGESDLKLVIWAPWKILWSISLEVTVNASSPADCTSLNVWPNSSLYSVPVPVSYGQALWSCAVPWSEIAVLTLILSNDAQVQTGGDITDSRLFIQLGQGNFTDIMNYTQPISILPGSHLTASLSWTQQQVIAPGFLAVLGYLAPLRTFRTTELNTIQMDWRTPGSQDTTTLSIFHARIDPIKFLQQYTEASAVTGLATIGGFWTFVNGAFALFFGANVMYFLLGRRPLSALGIVHVFQRRRLIQTWHQDFPALHTEGGRTGSEDAGIVAFLRERLVDLEDDELVAPEHDLEAQISSCHTCADLSYDELELANESKGSADDTCDGSSTIGTYADLARPRPGTSAYVGLRHIDTV